MRVMVMVKATKNSEAGVMPSEKLLAEMGQFNEQLVKAGIMLAGEGLHPSAKAKRVQFSGNQRKVIDGPFAETKELWLQRDGRSFVQLAGATGQVGIYFETWEGRGWPVKASAAARRCACVPRQSCQHSR